MILAYGLSFIYIYMIRIFLVSIVRNENSVALIGSYKTKLIVFVSSTCHSRVPANADLRLVCNDSYCIVFYVNSLELLNCWIVSLLCH